jgi:hypothetical protein
LLVFLAWARLVWREAQHAWRGWTKVLLGAGLAAGLLAMVLV